MGKPRRHHFLPQFYLRNFSNNIDQLWEFDRLLNKYTQKTSKGTAWLPHYYRYKDKEGKLHTDIEDFFGDIETKTKPIIDKIIKKKPITEGEKLMLSYFISFQRVRVPDFEKAANELVEKFVKKMQKFKFDSVERTEQILKKIKEQDSEKKVSAEEMYKFVQDEEYNVEVPREHSIRQML